MLAWSIADRERARLEINLEAGQPLFESLTVQEGATVAEVCRRVNPVVALTVGERDLANPAGWMAFFDNPPLRAYRTYALALDKRAVQVTDAGGRAVITVSEATAGPFRGRFQLTVFPGSPLLLAEAVLTTAEDGHAILYDAGLATPVPSTDSLGGARPAWRQIAWLDGRGAVQRAKVDPNRVAAPVTVTRRVLAAEGNGAALAVFPPPHQYFHPLDFATNLGFAWFGQSGDQWLHGYGFGVRQPPEGDRRWVPWCNAPAGTEQRLGLFYVIARGGAEAALAEAGRYTRDDRFKELPGHVTFSSHYHIEHTLELNRYREATHDAKAIPDELREPGFVRTFKERGIRIAHLAEFHFGEMPRLPAERRLALLRMLHEECARLSDDDLLVLPGEEPNVHLGGHWISLFPRPVNWVLHRAPGEPFEAEVSGYGRVYRVGSADDVLRLMEREGGLMWTAHPRIKSSRGYPDAYFDAPFARSDRFLGAAWKSMPVDLSLPRLGTRVFDLQDEWANRGARKYTPGEVDIFRVEPDMETYAHLNVNYLKLARAPRFADGWQPVLDALRGGKFFVTTGEVLVPDFRIAGRTSGDEVSLPADGVVEVRATLEWTFPLSFAELVSGDGHAVFRHRVDLSDTGGFGTRELRWSLPLAGRTWARLEVWDVAHNGAFTPPVWLK